MSQHENLIKSILDDDGNGGYDEPSFPSRRLDSIQSRFVEKDAREEIANIRSFSAPPYAVEEDSQAPPLEKDSFRADPAYRTYYHHQRLLNPRLPPPVGNWKNFPVGEKLEAPQPIVPPKQQVKDSWVEIASKQKPQHPQQQPPPPHSQQHQRLASSVVDRIQKDFPRTPSPVYTQANGSTTSTTPLAQGIKQGPQPLLIVPPASKAPQTYLQVNAAPAPIQTVAAAAQQQPASVSAPQNHQRFVRGPSNPPQQRMRAYQHEDALALQMQNLSFHGDNHYAHGENHKQALPINSMMQRPIPMQPRFDQLDTQHNAQLLAQQGEVVPHFGYYGPANNLVYQGGVYPVYVQNSTPISPMLLGYQQMKNPPEHSAPSQQKMYLNPQPISNPVYGSEQEFYNEPIQAPTWEHVSEQSVGTTIAVAKPEQKHVRKNNKTAKQVEPDYQPRSKLMEEFKGGKGRKWELKDISGHVKEFSRDQHGSRFIQQKLETANVADKALIFDEIYPHALELMTDVFGNYVIQKFFEYGVPDQKKMLAKVLEGHVMTLTIQTYGCRVIQKALEVIDEEDKSIIVEELDSHVLRCVQDQNGNHVIQKCIEKVPPRMVQFIVDSFANNVASQAVHAYGCRVIQRILEYCSEKQAKPVMDEILTNVQKLVKDQYGNYVVQHVLEHGQPKHKTSIIRGLKGQLVYLSQNKFASNVVEKCFENGSKRDRQEILDELMPKTKEPNSAPIFIMMKDQYANYVVQKIIELADESMRKQIIEYTKPHVALIRRFTFGKHILACIEKYSNEKLN